MAHAVVFLLITRNTQQDREIFNSHFFCLCVCLNSDIHDNLRTKIRYCAKIFVFQSLSVLHSSPSCSVVSSSLILLISIGLSNFRTSGSKMQIQILRQSIIYLFIWYTFYSTCLNGASVLSFCFNTLNGNFIIVIVISYIVFSLVEYLNIYFCWFYIVLEKNIYIYIYV